MEADKRLLQMERATPEEDSVHCLRRAGRPEMEVSSSGPVMISDDKNDNDTHETVEEGGRHDKSTKDQGKQRWIPAGNIDQLGSPIEGRGQENQ